jgi:uncharacterized protein YqgV (UPF0045/DUF77 family)
MTPTAIPNAVLAQRFNDVVADVATAVRSRDVDMEVGPYLIVGGKAPFDHRDDRAASP